MTGKTPSEKAVARRLILDQPLGVFIMAVIEHRTGLQQIAFRHAKGFEGGRRTIDAHDDIAQVHRLAGIDVQHQLRRLAGFDFAVDLRLIETQGLGGLFRLLFGTATETQQGFFVAIAETTDIALDVGLELIVGRFDPHIQFALCQRRTACDQHEQAAGKSS